MLNTAPTPAVLPLGRMARRLGVTQSWLRAEADAGRVPAARAGKGKYLFSAAAVEAALARRAAAGDPDYRDIIADVAAMLVGEVAP